MLLCVTVPMAFSFQCHLARTSPCSSISVTSIGISRERLERSIDFMDRTGTDWCPKTNEGRLERKPRVPKRTKHAIANLAQALKHFLEWFFSFSICPPDSSMSVQFISLPASLSCVSSSNCATLNEIPNCEKIKNHEDSRIAESKFEALRKSQIAMLGPCCGI